MDELVIRVNKRDYVMDRSVLGLQSDFFKVCIPTMPSPWELNESIPDLLMGCLSQQPRQPNEPESIYLARIFEYPLITIEALQKDIVAGNIKHWFHWMTRWQLLVLEHRVKQVIYRNLLSCCDINMTTIVDIENAIHPPRDKLFLQSCYGILLVRSCARVDHRSKPESKWPDTAVFQAFKGELKNRLIPVNDKSVLSFNGLMESQENRIFKLFPWK
jgi:hypothetical protein